MNNSKSIKSSNSKYTSISMVKIIKSANRSLTSISLKIEVTKFGGDDGYLLEGVMSGWGVVGGGGRGVISITTG